MRRTIGAIGLGALLCLPCIGALGGGALLAVAGGALVGAVHDPWAVAVGGLILTAGIALATRAVTARRRRRLDVWRRDRAAAGRPARLAR